MKPGAIVYNTICKDRALNQSQEDRQQKLFVREKMEHDPVGLLGTVAALVHDKTTAICSLSITKK